MHQKKFSKEQLKSTFFLVSETLIFHFQIIINYLQEPVEDKYPLVRNDSECCVIADFTIAKRSFQIPFSTFQPRKTYDIIQ